MKAIEEKAKAYDEAIKQLRIMMPNWENLSYNGKTFLQDLVHIIPELAESEDEKIRKALMQNLKERFGTKGNMGEGLDMPDVLAWLEKQGEQKTEIEYIYPKFRIGDVIEPIKPNGFYPPVRVLSIEKKTKSYCCESDDHKHYSSIPIRCENEYKLVEQKPADNVEPKFREGEWITIKE